MKKEEEERPIKDADGEEAEDAVKEGVRGLEGRGEGDEGLFFRFKTNKGEKGIRLVTTISLFALDSFLPLLLLHLVPHNPRLLVDHQVRKQSESPL